MTWPVRVGAVAAVFAGGVAAGHWLTPARMVTVDRAVTSDTEVRAATTAVAQAARAETQLAADLTKVRIVRIVERPDGGTETTTEERTEQHARRDEVTEQTKQEAQTRIEYRDRVEYRDRERVVERPVHARYGVAALAGVSIDARAPVAAVQFSGQLVGPVSVVVQAQRTFGGTPLDGWAALAGVEVRW